MLKVTTKKKTPHLAITHEAQGGSANMRHVSLVMKGVDELTPEQASLLKEIVGENEKQEVEKGTYASLQRNLSIAVDARAKETDRWGWSYVRDFDDTHVVYSKNDGVFAAPYTDSDGVITLGDEIVVNEMLSWEDSSGKIIVSQSDSVDSGVKGLVIKSFDSPKLDNEKLIDIFKSKYEEDIAMNELQKENAELRSEVEKSQAQVAELMAKLEEIQKSQKEAQEAQRLEIVKSVTTEENVETLFQSLKDLDEGSFTTIVKSLESATKLAQEKSGMFEEVSKSAEEMEPEVKNEIDEFTAFVKSQQK